jgi:tol-pal system protein YbgF
MLKNLLVVLLCMAAPVLEAQVRVVESSPQGVRSGVAQPSLPVSAQSDVYSQIRSLQDEVTTLRGLIEEQAYELKQLKQLQLDNYIDLDRRLSGAAKATTTKSESISPSATVAVPDLSSAPVLADGVSESDAYKAAYDLLNQKNFDGAVDAFKAYLVRFPNGEFASNSHYWLGKVAMLKKDYPAAKQWFSELIDRFPNASKVSATKLDLGKVYYILGDKVKAKVMLTEVAAGNDDVARLADKFLSENF